MSLINRIKKAKAKAEKLSEKSKQAKSKGKAARLEKRSDKKSAKANKLSGKLGAKLSAGAAAAGAAAREDEKKWHDSAKKMADYSKKAVESDARRQAIDRISHTPPSFPKDTSRKQSYKAQPRKKQ